MTGGGIKSKERVNKFGEVYTPDNIVKDMLDLVKEESYSIDSTFLEPACGNGNFLVEILTRKLEIVGKLPIGEYDKNMFTAVSTIYAIDILEDNVEESRARMLNIVKNTYTKIVGKEIDTHLLKSIIYILDRNIMWGDGLTGLSEKPEDFKSDLIVFEWRLDGEQVHITEQTFNSLLEKEEQEQMVLDLGMWMGEQKKEYTVESLYILGDDVSLDRDSEIIEWYNVYRGSLVTARKEVKETKKPAQKKKAKSLMAW